MADAVAEANVWISSRRSPPTCPPKALHTAQPDSQAAVMRIHRNFLGSDQDLAVQIIELAKPFY